MRNSGSTVNSLTFAYENILISLTNSRAGAVQFFRTTPDGGHHFEEDLGEEPLDPSAPSFNERYNGHWWLVRISAYWYEHALAPGTLRKYCVSLRPLRWYWDGGGGDVRRLYR